MHLKFIFNSKWRVAYANVSERVFNSDVVTKSLSFESIFDKNKAYFKCHSQQNYGHDTIEGTFI